MIIPIPYGKGFLQADIQEERVAGIIRSKLDTYVPDRTEQELINHAMDNPIGTKSLYQLAQGCEKVVIIASDHTRPVPSKLILPGMLQEIRKGNPQADITILIATGCHRETKKEELVEKFGIGIVEQEKIVIHDCDAGDLCYLGTLPSGGKLYINRIAAEADLLVAEGFIEPHFFAGYSGGRKSVLPGIASRKTIYANHCAEFINHENARYGSLKGNPIHEDMLVAAKKLQYIVNVVINSRHKVIGAFAGDCEKAHLTGVNFLEGLCKTSPIPADIVVTSNNGYPLDQNIYQTVKGMATAEKTCKKDGVIIMAAECRDGCGGDAFYRTFSSAESAKQVLEDISIIPRDKTVTDQWQSQIFARILSKHPIIFVSSCEDKIINEMHMIPAKSISEALKKADEILEGKEKKVTFIPEGITSIIE
ncbi:MAG: nickel-dependent lactate racemase [Anaerocolumna sp.]